MGKKRDLHGVSIFHSIVKSNVILLILIEFVKCNKNLLEIFAKNNINKCGKVVKSVIY